MDATRNDPPSGRTGVKRTAVRRGRAVGAGLDSHRLRPSPAARVIQARGDGQAAGRVSILGGVLSQQTDMHDGRAESAELTVRGI